MAALDAEYPLVILTLGLGTDEIAARHGETVRQKISQAQNQQDHGRQIRADHPGDDRECRHGAVDAAINPVPEIIAMRASGEAITDRLLAVAMLERMRRSLSFHQFAMRTA